MTYQTDLKKDRPGSRSRDKAKAAQSGPPSPHDAIFRRMFGVTENAASLLRSVLPPGLTCELDLTRLALVPDAFADKTLRRRQSDLLFTVPVQGRDQKGEMYLLVEHQHESDWMTALWLEHSAAEIWNEYIKDHPRARCRPAVLPLVVHSGSSPWSAPRGIQDLITPLSGEEDEAISPYVPRSFYFLDDLAVIEPGQLRDRDLTVQARVTLLLLKIAPGNPRLHEDLQAWKDDLRELLDQPEGHEAFLALLKYAEDVSATPESDLAELAASLGPDAKETLMTTAEMLKAEGEAQGEARGKEQGEVFGRADTLLEFLNARFGPLPDDRVQSVREASSDQLKLWTRRTATVATLDEVFA